MGQVFAILVAIKVANTGGPERYLTVSGVAVQSILAIARSGNRGD